MNATVRKNNWCLFTFVLVFYPHLLQGLHSCTHSLDRNWSIKTPSKTFLNKTRCRVFGKSWLHLDNQLFCLVLGSFSCEMQAESRKWFSLEDAVRHTLFGVVYSWSNQYSQEGNKSFQKVFKVAVRGNFKENFKKNLKKNLLKAILGSSFLTNTTIERRCKWKSTNSSGQTTDHCTTILFTRSSSSIKFGASIVSAMPTLPFVPLQKKKKAFREQRHFFFCVCSASLQHHYGASFKTSNGISVCLQRWFFQWPPMVLQEKNHKTANQK